MVKVLLKRPDLEYVGSRLVSQTVAIYLFIWYSDFLVY